jgi:glutamate-1-semialdehyde aminotransferase
MSQGRYCFHFDEVMTGFRLAPGGAQERLKLMQTLLLTAK